ncbi:hypothetical protein CWE15_07860 [Aliidiomarina taiwanensis]|uniref:Uncharacterized protein n=1 Tax=Aliidiomarina taiwanensis TaxID=946228 RepID=A0A432X192_9GAMM|nr:DUF6776 family protein [Aliidiomarina taiwanensis]RUO40053.1 hypothetical protein CWE15_07860 [Aliidiomarina taiwanensis]
MFNIGNVITRKTLLIVIASLLAAVALGYYAATAHIKWQLARGDWLAQQNSSLYERIAQLEYQINILQVEIDVERGASAVLQQDVEALIAEKSELTRELTFYQRVVSPEQSTKGVIQDSFVVTPSRANNSYYYRLILLQLDRRVQQRISGRFDIEIVGQLDQENVTLNLLELANTPDTSGRFQIHYYALAEGTFTLPDGFTPQYVKVTAKADNARAIEQTYQWQVLLGSPAGSVQEAPSEE